LKKAKTFLLLLTLVFSILYFSEAAFSIQPTVSDSPSTDESSVSTQEVNSPLILEDIRVENYPDAARITITTNRYFEYIDYDLENGSIGIIFDPMEPIYTNMTEPVFDKNGLIENVKFSKGSVEEETQQVQIEKGFYPLDYFVVTLSNKTNYYVSQRANTVVIDIGKRKLPRPDELSASFVVKRDSEPEKFNTELPAPKTEPFEVLQPEPLKTQPMKEEKILPDTLIRMPEKLPRVKPILANVPRLELPKKMNALNYKDCIGIGMENYLPLVIAEEEVRLNDLKVDEAKRGLYPTATAKYTTTDGMTSGVEFVEKSYGMQVEQPLYYGGRLKLTLKQAQVNRQVSQTKFDKVETELIAKVTETFYSMVTAQLNFQDQQELLNDSRKILELAQKKYEAGLTTKLEFMNVQSQCNQVDYQLEVATKDLDVARLNLLQAMGVDSTADIFVDFDSDCKGFDVDINKCLLLAYQNRPELHMNELLQEASEYEERIAKSKDDFKVDFTGFLGQSGGAYKTEPLNVGSDWYLGFKASKPWMGNTGSYNFTQNKTSPKLGQNTRTGGTSHSFEFGILNNLTGKSEKQTALINKLKAESDLIDIEKTINLEVREAYNNYDKAVMQINNALDKIEFRKEELKVLQAQSEINEALLSQVLEAMVKLNDEKALYHQAIASYKTAVANLNKAVGLIDYFN